MIPSNIDIKNIEIWLDNDLKNGIRTIDIKNIDCLMAHTTCLDCFISTVNGRSRKRRKEACYELR